jgi:rubrerythrin
MEDGMSDQGNVCYTFEGAVELAISMEDEGFRSYLDALRKVTMKGAKEILKEAALDELNHKHQLEIALIDGYIAGETFQQPVPTMNLDYVLAKKELNANSTPQEALAFSIHLEKGAIEFYRRMASGCAGAPMGELFTRLLADESRHLQSLEDLYEEHFLTEN